MSVSAPPTRPAGPPALVPEMPEPPRRVDVPMKAPDEPPGFFDRPEVVRRLQRGFLAIMAGLVVADLFIHHHVWLGSEEIPGFYTAFSFGACLALFALSKAAAAFLKREEDYYD